MQSPVEMFQVELFVLEVSDNLHYDLKKKKQVFSLICMRINHKKFNKNLVIK